MSAVGKRTTYNWKVPREWEGETAVILGGGPSLTKQQAELARVFRRVAVNDAGLVLAPDADVMCWGDPRWYQWNAKDLRLFKGKYAITWREMGVHPGSHGFYKLDHAPASRWLSTDPKSVVANNSGLGAINIAFLFGVRRILLLGFDMRCVDGVNNWHKRHKQGTAESRYKDVFGPAIMKAGQHLAKYGVTVINCTPNSGLKCFPFRKLEDIVKEEQNKSPMDVILPPGPIPFPHSDTQIKRSDVVIRKPEKKPKKDRKLEIGPGKNRDKLEDFESIDIVPGRAQRTADARKLPFPSNTFSVLFSSHVIEHVNWFETDATLKEWARIIAPGGTIEIWTVNAYAIAKAYVEYEETGVWTGPKLGPGSWKDVWIGADPYKWCAGRLFCYPKGHIMPEANLHRTMWTPKSLAAALERAGFKDVRPMTKEEVRGRDHGWINMGVKGTKA